MEAPGSKRFAYQAKCRKQAGDAGSCKNPYFGGRFERLKSKVRPKKHLGQHFLTDAIVAEQTASLFDHYSDRLPILEIGPGTGILTQFLLKKGVPVTAVEIDSESVAYLRNTLVPGGLRLIEGDILQHTNDEILFPSDICLIGNFPYNISSQIVFKVLEKKDKVKYFGGMFQKEVADRLVAGPGSKTYGILSVLLNTFYDTRYAFTVSPDKFDPPPKVQSAVIGCVRKESFVLPCRKSLFFDVVKTAFNQRRKTLRNALHKFNLHETHEFAKLRAEQLSPADFIKLTQSIEQSG